MLGLIRAAALVGTALAGGYLAVLCAESARASGDWLAQALLAAGCLLGAVCLRHLPEGPGR